MSLASLVPVPRVDPAILPSFLPWSLRYNVLYPYSLLFSHVVETRDDCPPWTAELEAYHDTFNYCVWYYLDIDDGNDRVALKAAQERAEALRKSQMLREADDGASLADLEWAIERLTTRCRLRWDRIYGLHLVRNRYISWQRTLRPEVGYFKIMQKTLVEQSFEPPKAERQSLWPLPINLPRDPGMQPNPMVCWSDTSVDWSEYVLPDRPTQASEDVRRRIERGNLTIEKVVAESQQDAPVAEDAETPLLNPSVSDARSSGFFSIFGGFLRRRHH